MKLGVRIFLCCVVIFAACFYYPIDYLLDTLRIRYLEGVEDPLVDQANILAGIVGDQMAQGRFDPRAWDALLRRIHDRSFAAKIYDLEKTTVDMDIYVTDREGKVLFDSSNPGNRGRDFSRWRDVHLSLRGEYGARSTQVDPLEPTSSVLYVAAPVRVAGDIAGVLTVAKPTTNINNFLAGAKPKIIRTGLTALVAAMLLSLLAAYLITRPIRRLTHYADEIRRGKRVPLPRLGGTEIGRMGRAFERMLEALEGRKYIERYVQTLTHEIKSPLSAIRGAAELLEEKMAPERRSRFLSNIRAEAARVQDIVDRMLQLSEIEALKTPRRVERVSLRSVARSVVESKRPMLVKKRLTVNTGVPAGIDVRGEAFLLHQAVGNLVQNAIEFSPAGARIDLDAALRGDRVVLRVRDVGPGIPDFAGARLFEKFFSLQRPDGGGRSTGLGLNFVREVAHLHGGEVTLENRTGGGACATLVLAP